ncbi:hypothetical protein N9430_05010, partial [Candidatus Pelagibacter sp.]|nr:hypothetical protein [Candidatus Pelagibacter sp.]
GYSYQIPNIYLNKLTINKTTNNELVEFNSIVEFIQSNQSNQSNKILLDRSNILDRFIQELKDVNKIRKKILNSSTEDQKVDSINKYANSIKIVGPNDKEGNYTLNFEWNNPDEAKKILQDILTLVLNRLDNLFLKELKKSLEIEKKYILVQDSIRTEYLIEQSLIAKELQILDNQIDAVNLSQSSVLFNINTSGLAYYLRGSKAIDKEIELIKKRDYQKFKFIEKEINSLKETNIQWVHYNIHSMNSKLLKDTRSILVTSILFGLMVGIFYVFISNAIKFTASKK